MTIARPGSRGLFSHMQQALKMRDITGRMRVNSHVQAANNDFCWLAKDLQRQLIQQYELIAAPPALLGTPDASGKGMGGIATTPHAATHNNNINNGIALTLTACPHQTRRN